jgi:RNA recognition motif-containing protein
MNIFVGNLSYSTQDDGLRVAFEAYGEVSSARVIADRESGRSRGFGFVEMPNAAEGQAAIDALDGQELDGRTVKVNEARPKEEGGRGGGNRRY